MKTELASKFLNYMTYAWTVEKACVQKLAETPVSESSVTLQGMRLIDSAAALERTRNTAGHQQDG